MTLDVACCIAYVLILLVVVAWLVYELRADKRDRINPTVPGPQERLLVKSDI